MKKYVLLIPAILVIWLLKNLVDVVILDILTSRKISKAVPIEITNPDAAKQDAAVAEDSLSETKPPFPNLDPAKIEAIKGSGYYVKDLSGAVYYKGYYSGREFYLATFDLYTIEAIDSNFIKDKNKVYLISFDGDHELLEGVDAPTFRKIGDNLYVDQYKQYSTYIPYTSRTPSKHLLSADFGEEFPRYW